MQTSEKTSSLLECFSECSLSYVNYISASRYQSYLSMLQDKDENKYREAY